VGGDVVPSLSKSHNFIEEVEGWQVLKGSHRRMGFVLVHEIKALAAIFGVERLGFLTLTFKDNVRDLREAQRRFHSLETNVIKARYKRSVGVWERQERGAVHFHLIVVLDADIRSGADFQAFERRDYRSANSALRSEWAFWRKTAPAYRFGRTELLPVKSTAEGIAAYVGKYVSKHIANRTEADLGARVIRFIGYGPGDRRASARMGWANDRAWLWRHKLASFAGRQGMKSTEDLADAFGSRWCFKLQEQILLEPLSGQTVFPSLECALLSSDMAWRRLVMVDHARYLREKAGQGVGAVQYELRPFESGRGVQVTPSSGIEHARQSSPRSCVPPAPSLSQHLTFKASGVRLNVKRRHQLAGLTDADATSTPMPPRRRCHLDPASAEWRERSRPGSAWAPPAGQSAF
jgi:hypothetical protein